MTTRSTTRPAQSTTWSSTSKNIHLGYGKDAVGGAWLFWSYSELSGVEDHRAFTSERKVRAWVRATWGDVDWEHTEGSTMHTAVVHDVGVYEGDRPDD